MRISAKSKYALAALMVLAEKSSQNPTPTAAIAEELEISKIYLEQVFAQLKKGGLVFSTKGSQGGYLLAKEPDSITMLDILLETEGALFEKTAMVFPEKQAFLDQVMEAGVWSRMESTLTAALEQITLEELLRKKKELTPKGQPMFYI